MMGPRFLLLASCGCFALGVLYSERRAERRLRESALPADPQHERSSQPHHFKNRLRTNWSTYEESHLLDQWDLYADTYQRFLPTPQTNGPELRMLKIGIQSGGSARTWKQFYDEQLYYAGIDVDPLSRRIDNHSKSIYVEIGSQSDYDFLRSVCVKHGPFGVRYHR